MLSSSHLCCELQETENTLWLKDSRHFQGKVEDSSYGMCHQNNFYDPAFAYFWTVTGSKERTLKAEL